MFDPNFIIKNLELEESQDFALLRRKGIEQITQLTKALWTDYNTHDPGITILEAFAYAITDLGYRTGYDIKDILTKDDNGIPKIDANFHTAKNIFSNNPTTFDDLRKVLIDLDGVRNAWIRKHESIRYYFNRNEERLEIVPYHLVQKDGNTSALPCDPSLDAAELCKPLNGLYDVLLQYEDTVIPEVETYFIDLSYEGTARSDMTPNGQGLRFDVHRAIILQSLKLQSDTVGEVTVSLINPSLNIEYSVDLQVNFRRNDL